MRLNFHLGLFVVADFGMMSVPSVFDENLAKVSNAERAETSIF